MKFNSSFIKNKTMINFINVHGRTIEIAMRSA